MSQGGRFRFVNPAFVALTGTTAEELLKIDFSDLVHPDEPPLADWKEPAPSAREVRIRVRDGVTRWVDLRTASVVVDQARAMVGTALDITDRKWSERRQNVHDTVSQWLLDAPTLERAAPAIIEVVCRNLEWDVLSILRLDPESAALRCVTAGGAAPGAASLLGLWSSTLPLSGESLPRQAWSRRVPVFVPDLPVERRLPEASSAGVLRGALVVPVLPRRGAGGVLALARRRFGAPEPAEIAAIVDLARQVARFIDRRDTEESLRASELRYRLLFERNLAGVYRKSLSGRILDCNDAFARTVGFPTRQALLSRSFVDLYADARERERFLERLRREGSVTSYEIRLRKYDGSAFWALQNVHLVSNEGSAPFIEGTLIDISAQKATEENLERLAYHDALTGLPNRALFYDRLRVAGAQAQRNGRGLAVVFLDLDGFKTVNDTLGHDAGDRLLRRVAERLRRSVREGDTVARLGGDEFGILLVDVDRKEEVTEAVKKLLRALEAPHLQPEGRELHVTGSLGISTLPGDSSDVETLVKLADRAMYRAKEAGKNGYRFADGTRVLERPPGDRSIASAAALRDFALHFERIVDARSASPTGLEALLRWRHPSGVEVPLREFLPLAEETDLIVPIGTWHLWAAARQLVAFGREGRESTVSISIPAGFLRYPRFIRLLDKILGRTGVNPEKLVLQIPERARAAVGAPLASLLRSIEARGLSAWIDEVWLGHSPVEGLLALPIGGLKIDVSLLGPLRKAAGSIELVRKAVHDVHRAGRLVAARGVASADTAALLRDEGVDLLQGPCFGEAVEASEASALLGGSV